MRITFFGEYYSNQVSNHLRFSRFIAICYSGFVFTMFGF